MRVSFSVDNDDTFLAIFRAAANLGRVDFCDFYLQVWSELAPPHWHSSMLEDRIDELFQAARNFQNLDLCRVAFKRERIFMKIKRPGSSDDPFITNADKDLLCGAVIGRKDICVRAHRSHATVHDRVIKLASSEWYGDRFLPGAAEMIRELRDGDI